MISVDWKIRLVVVWLCLTVIVTAGKYVYDLSPELFEHWVTEVASAGVPVGLVAVGFMSFWWFRLREKK